MNNQEIRAARSFLGLQQEEVKVAKKPLSFKQKLLYIWLLIIYVGILPVLMVQKFHSRMKRKKRFAELANEWRNKVAKLKEEHQELEKEINDLHHRYHGVKDDAIEDVIVSKYVRLGELERQIGDFGGKL